MEISKLTVTNTLTHKNSGFTPEPSNIFFFFSIQYITFSTGWTYCINLSRMAQQASAEDSE